MARKKRIIATLDCETDPFEYGLEDFKSFLWDIYDGKEHYTFLTVESVVDFLADKNWIVYAHNGGKFSDFHELMPFVESGDEIKMVNGRIARFKIGECEFRDSYLILPMPLKGYKKGEIDYDKMKRDCRHLHMKEITEYLHDDTLYLYEIVTEFISKYGSGMTLAGSAFKLFNKEFSENENSKTNEVFYSQFSDFYYGGRVECFEKGIIDYPVKMIDINSAYPRAMLQRHAYGKQFLTSSKMPENKDEIEKAFFRIKAVSKGALPFRSESGLVFPNDNEEREYFVTGWELLAGLETKTLTIIELIECHEFCEFITFDRYVNHFYELKNNSEKQSTDYIFAKLFLNSLYGKYASNPHEYTRSFVFDDPVDAANWGLEVTGKIGERFLAERDLFDEEKTFYNVATAASITGWVRAYLWRALNSVKNPVYCDTDSIICEEIGNLPIGKKLGQWGIDGEFSGGGIGGKKIYALEYKEPLIKNGKKITHKTACKGARLSASEILDVCKGEIVVYKNPVPNFSFKTSKKYIDRKIRMT